MKFLFFLSFLQALLARETLNDNVGKSSCSGCSNMFKISQYPDIQQRKMKAILGAIHGDAAAVPLQWIYDQDQLNKVVKDKDPLFWNQYLNPYFKIAEGSVSMYGDELLTTLSTISKDGYINITNISMALKSKFGSPQSPYQESLKKRKESAKADYPIEGPWITSCVIKALKNLDEGKSPSGSKDCRDNDPFFFALPAFLLNLDLDEAETVAKVISDDEATLRYVRVQNMVLKYFINGGDWSGEVPQELTDILVLEGKGVEEDIKEVSASIRVTRRRLDSFIEIVQDEVKRWGQSCKLPGAFKSQLAIMTMSNKTFNMTMSNTTFSSLMSLNILAGGDVCGRSIFLGAVSGATGDVPDYVFGEDRVDNIDNIVDDLIKVYS